MSEQTSKYLRPIRKGEYDLVNISLIGYDPNDGRSYEECHAEWQNAFEGLTSEQRRTHWWHISRILRNRWRTVALASHLGTLG